ncbi:Protein phosphatase 2C 6 [Lodderomyces elongisporus]|uniref:Protein phosphatase 2C 6 n=1 Tax=Lodderomyces elongisporus TaxID=36914 RepID=UPI00291F50A3|nr:Protein phosphatase 2C 6 [Lodderomyces elongisporus]WLF78769.1 Protein phosphatase 2C 6 [Lodderomyces elongisporus]
MSSRFLSRPHSVYKHGLFSNHRHLSDSVVFTAVDRSPNLPLATTQPLKQGKLRVPLLKSPSHLGHFTSRVNRPYNEDKYSAKVLNINGQEIINFNIFDGHGGDECSTFLAENLSASVEAYVNGKSDIGEGKEELVKKYAKNVGGYWKRWYKHREKAFTAWNKNKINLKHFEKELEKVDLNLRIPLSYLALDYDFCSSTPKSGSTCTSAFLQTIYTNQTSQFQPFYENFYFNRKTISLLTIAHIGDTRAILVDKNGLANGLTADHHPSDPEESQRLRRYAANFFMADSFGEERFIALANTRAFGDVDYKEVGVTAEPDFAQFVIGDSHEINTHLTDEEIKKYTVGGLGGDECFLILCSDGVTNVLTDQEIADIVMTTYRMSGHSKASPQKCANEVVKFVEYVGGDDNATVLVVRLNGWGQWPNIDRTGELRQSRLDYNPRRGSG